MPITAIPQGVEIRKITAVQKRALDELLGKQKETSLLQTLIPSFSFIAVASIGAYIYIKRDTIKEELLELEETIRQMAGRGVTEAFTTFGETVTGGGLSGTVQEVHANSLLLAVVNATSAPAANSPILLSLAI